MSGPRQQPWARHEGGYESSDANVRLVGVFLAALVLGCAAAAFAVHWTLVAFTGGAPRGGAEARVAPRELPPAPRLEPQPRHDLREWLARERALLGGYAWVDREAGVVRIPIERAIEILEEEGLPARDEPAPRWPGAPSEERR
jgi:hypothetical protein